MHITRGWVRGFAIVLCLAALAACATKEWPWLVEADKEAKSFRSVPGMAMIYLYRQEPISPTFRVGIFMDGEVIGALDTKSFILCRVAAGPHEIASRETEAAHLTLQTEAGGLYFVEHRYPDMMVAGARTEFRVTDAAQAKREIRELQLMASACSRVLGTGAAQSQEPQRGGRP